MRSGVRAVVCAAGAALVMSLGAAGAAHAAGDPGYPVVFDGLAGYGAHLLTPDVPATGSSYVTWSDATPAASCHSATHPYPVVLVGGTYVNQDADFSAVAPLLADNGYCVYTSNYGAPAGDPIQQTGPIPTSAQELSTVVGKVLAATGASRVDLVGHSQGGGDLPRWYLKYDGGADRVSVLVGLAPSNHGTTVDGVEQLSRQLGALGLLGTAIGPAADEQLEGSAFNAQLDAGGDTVPGVSYTDIVSRYDEVVTPYTNQFLTAGPGATVHNILLQDVCPLDHGEHLSVVYDQVALRLMLNALDPATALTPPCVPIAPVAGG